MAGNQVYFFSWENVCDSNEYLTRYTYWNSLTGGVLSWEGHNMIFPIIRGKHPPEETREQGWGWHVEAARVPQLQPAALKALNTLQEQKHKIRRRKDLSNWHARHSQTTDASNVSDAGLREWERPNTCWNSPTKNPWDLGVFGDWDETLARQLLALSISRSIYSVWLHRYVTQNGHFQRWTRRRVCTRLSLPLPFMFCGGKQT